MAECESAVATVYTGAGTFWEWWADVQGPGGAGSERGAGTRLRMATRG